MSYDHDLIVTARRLARANPRRPRQANLKRAVSTAYYATFHALARLCADLIIGVGADRSRPAWRQVYRALDHGFARNACSQAGNLGFLADVQDFANSFVQLQEERHRADYDPDARYSRAEAQLLISNAEQAISGLRRSRRPDLRAFSALVLLKKR